MELTDPRRGDGGGKAVLSFILEASGRVAVLGLAFSFFLIFREEIKLDSG